MPKNVFFLSFLYVFIACAMFIAVSVHSKPTQDMTTHIAITENLPAAGYSRWLHNAGGPWYRK